MLPRGIGIRGYSTGGRDGYTMACVGYLSSCLIFALTFDEIWDHDRLPGVRGFF